ncbi:TPA: phage major capsid protein, partial [Proteus mirabilis]|nr:phage major capsid protein [Proteus mirabilis]
MSDLSQIQKAIEASQAKVKELFDEQKKQIEETGNISKQLQADLTAVQEE